MLNKSAIKSPDNKFIDITLKDGSKGLMFSSCTLIWTKTLFMAKHSMKTKYITKQLVNYREEDEVINKLLPCTELICNEYQTDKDSMIDLCRSK